MTSTAKHEPDAAQHPTEELRLRRTRVSTAWAVAGGGLVVGLLTLIFILQNDKSQRMTFLWVHFTLPLGVGFLMAAVLGGLLVVLLGMARLFQVRLAAHRHRRAERRATSRRATASPS
jgi:uncharacterized integral membrane protein